MPTEQRFVADYDNTLQSYLELLPPMVADIDTAVIAFHGHGSHREQFMTPGIYDDAFTPVMQLLCERNIVYIAPEYRGNSWMNAAAVSDCRQIICSLRAAYGVKHIVLIGGSMGGTSVLIYAALHPEGISGVLAACPATDMAELYDELQGSRWDAIAQTIAAQYGGIPELNPAEYSRRSSRRHVENLKMPISIIHGNSDALISVNHSRIMVQRLRELGSPVIYREITDGDHDAPVQFFAEELAALLDRIA